MENLTAFANSFYSYLVVFFTFGITIVIACLIGIGLRKNKNAKMASGAETESAEKAGSGE